MMEEKRRGRILVTTLACAIGALVSLVSLRHNRISISSWHQNHVLYQSSQFLLNTTSNLRSKTRSWFWREGNTCLANRAEKLFNPPNEGSWGMSQAECTAWIINTTDLVWRPSQSEREVVDAIEYYYFVDFESRSGAVVRRGLEARKAQVLATRRAFSDLQVRIDDVFCIGNDINGYKASITQVLIGTNDGPSRFGKATHRSVAYAGIVNVFIHKDATDSNRLKYKAHLMVHDELSLLIQLGLSPPSSTAIVQPPQRCAVLGPMTWFSSSYSSSSSSSETPRNFNSSSQHLVLDDDDGADFVSSSHSRKKNNEKEDDDDNEENYHGGPSSPSSLHQGSSQNP